MPGTVGSGQFIDFIDDTGKVTLRSGATFAGIFGFTTVASGNTIDVRGISATSLGFDTGTQEPELLDGSSSGVAHYGNFHLANDGNGGTQVFDPPVSSGGPGLATPH